MSCFPSDVLRIFGIVPVSARVFAERGFCQTVHLSDP